MACCRWLVGLTWLLSLSLVTSYGLRLGSFNVEIFNTTKGHKDHVMGYIAKIAVRYDILNVLEVRDPTNWVLDQLVQRIKRDHGVDMKYLTTPSIGTDIRHIEQYTFLYREDKGISIDKSYYIYDDGDEKEGTDLFEREPAIARFKIPNCVISDLVLVAFHPPPADALHDLKLLPQVYENVRKTFPQSNIIILGDLNADCKFVPKEALPELEIRQRPEFWWPIDDDADTTVKAKSHCAYDRFILVGEGLKKAVVPGSAKVFDFMDKYGLTEQQALEISDHKVIELELQDVDMPGALEQQRDIAGDGQAASSWFGSLWNLWTQHYIIIVVVIFIAFILYRRSQSSRYHFGSGSRKV